MVCAGQLLFRGPHLLQWYDAKINTFCCDLIAINGSKGRQNTYTMMSICKKSGFMLCQV